MDIGFIQDFIIRQVDGTRPSEIKTMIYRDGGVEIAPGEVAPAIIPEWLKDQTVEIEITEGKGKVKSDYGEYDIEVGVEPSVHKISTDHSAGDHNLTQIEDIDPTHKLTINIKGKLKDGDSVVVGKYNGLTKYVILCKAES